MKPLNQKERTAAFWKFLGIYVFTTALVAVAIYFDYRVPPAEYQILKAEKAKRQENASSQAALLVQMDSMKSYFRKIDKNFSRYEVLINKKIVEMEQAYPDSGLHKRLIDHYNYLLAEKSTAKDLREKSGDITKNYSDCNTELKDAKAELSQCQSELRYYKPSPTGF